MQRSLEDASTDGQGVRVSGPRRGAPDSVSAGVHSITEALRTYCANYDVATTSNPVPTEVRGTKGTLPLSGQTRGPSRSLSNGSLGARPTA